MNHRRFFEKLAIESTCRRCGKSGWILLCLTIKISSTHETMYFFFLQDATLCSTIEQKEKARFHPMIVIFQCHEVELPQNYYVAEILLK